MIKSDIFIALISIFKEFTLKDRKILIEDIYDELKKTGAPTEDLNFLFKWLNNFVDFAINYQELSFNSPKTVRLISNDEAFYIPYHFFIFLYNKFLKKEIELNTFEFILNQIFILIKYLDIELSHESFIWIYNMSLIENHV